jgi:threonine dehydrogenase-like Zn-dependent dehydrogenase
MRGALLYGTRDLRFEERDTPAIIKPTDAIISNEATCVCGSDPWPYRGIAPVPQPKPMGHEYCGIVEEIGSAVTSIKRGQVVIGSFFASDNTCFNCQTGYPRPAKTARSSPLRRRRCCVFHSPMGRLWLRRVFPRRTWFRVC